MSDPLRILSVVHGFPPEFTGGTELYALRSGQALQALGHEVTVLTGSGEAREPPCVEDARHEDLPVRRLHRCGLFLDDWRRSWAGDAEALFVRELERQRPDVLHVHHWIRLTRTLVARAAELGIPSVVTLHDLWTCGPADDATRPPGAAPGEVEILSEPALDEEERELLRLDLARELCAAHTVITPSAAHAAELERRGSRARGASPCCPMGPSPLSSPRTRRAAKGGTAL